MFINSRTVFDAKLRRTLAELSNATRSNVQATRVSAMQELITLARQQPSARPAAVEIFRASLPAEWDPYTAVHAVRGLDTFASPEEARVGWLGLLHHPNADMVAVAALLVRADFFGELVEILQQRPELQIQTAVIRALGRMKNHAAFSLVRQRLDHADLRRDAIEALGELGDPRAIPALQAWLDDRTPVELEDNHGPMLRTCDFASRAIEQIEKATSLNVPEEHRTVDASKIPPLLSAGADQFGAVRSGSAGSNQLAYAPLVAAAFGIPWVFAMMIVAYANRGRTAAFDVIVMVPAVIGLGLSLVAARRSGMVAREKVALAAGVLGCIAYVAVFGRELLH
ncbi:MAG: HEAT repeat domain-containing protein [Opitutus sp.]